MHKINFLFLAFLFSVFSYSATKKPVEKSAKISHLSESAQRRFDYYFYEGLKQKENSQYDQALETFRLCAALDSVDSGVQSELGLLYAATGFTAESISCMEKAIKTDPTNWWYNVQLISMYSEQKNWKRSIEIALNLQKLYPDKEDVYTMLASFYKETKQFDKAIAAYEHLESLTGINQALSLEKFQLYILLNNKKKGIAEIVTLPTKVRVKVYTSMVELPDIASGSRINLA